ncbi:MAG: MBL fold metallo-hydrolase [Acidimicrobiia bacterium]
MHGMNRRDFLRCAGGLTMTTTLARVGSLSAWTNQPEMSKAGRTLVDKGFASAQEIDKGIFAIVSDMSKGTQTVCNGGFIVGQTGTLVIESFASSAGAAFAVEAARMAAQVPFKAAVLTHYHFDHSFGTAHYGSQGIPVMSHPKARDLIQQQYVALQGQDKTSILAGAAQKVAAARDAADRQHAESDLNAMKLMFGLIDNTVLALPNQPLRLESLPQRIDLGGVTVVLEAHPGHTPTDIVIRVPERNIAFAGDLLFQKLYPVCFDADMTAWRKVLDRFLSWGPSHRFVPGHGPVCGPEGVRAMAEILDHLRDHARISYDRKAPLEEAQRTYSIPDKFKDWGMFAWGFSVGAAIEKYYGEFKKQ